MGEGELSASVVGMLYAVVAILWSARNHSLMLHKVGMALLGVVIAKIFLVDMSGLQGSGRLLPLWGSDWPCWAWRGFTAEAVSYKVNKHSLK